VWERIQLSRAGSSCSELGSVALSLFPGLIPLQAAPRPGAARVLILGLMTVVGYVIGFRFQAGLLDALACIAVVSAFGLALSWVFAFVALTVRGAEAAQSAGFVVLFPHADTTDAYDGAEARERRHRPTIAILERPYVRSRGPRRSRCSCGKTGTYGARSHPPVDSVPRR
jgi:hypothetical protein